MAYRKSKLLVTGGLGFVGRFLLEELKRRGDYDLYIIERYVTGRYANLGRTVQTHFVDLRDASQVRETIRFVQPDVVIHTAAISPVSYSYDHPNEVIENNLFGTINLAEACRQLAPSITHFIFAGTTEEYGMTTERPATEKSQCIPNSPYAISKNACTKYLQYLNLAYHFPTTIMRATNTYGRTDDTHFFIEKIITQMLTNPKGDVFLGEDDAVREFMYVEDHVNAYLSVLDNPGSAIGEIFNFSTGDPKTLNEVIHTIAELTEFRGEFVKHSLPKRPLDIPNHTIDSTKARNILKWNSKWSLKDGLQTTINFWKKKLAD